MTGREIREKFLAYFEGNGHRRVRSASLLPANDPTLFFTNAGMVPFKDVFLGQEKRDYARAASAQKCMRVSGKHNDLENVGRTPRHHTFFEMLGNFSFGDYFKQEAIAFAWEFLIREAGLPPERLRVTVFREDDEAERLWRKMSDLPASRITRLDEKDNFWAMGDTGPCGPCSEIHLDRGPAAGCGRPDCVPGCDCDRFLEIWNLVFMQFSRDQSGKLTPLPRPSIDTGMGLERLAMCLQGKESNYDTDLLRPFVEEAARLARVPYGKAGESDVSLRVIADHVRAMTFLVADGISPGNEGRGYVLRRIMRRACRHGKMLGMSKPFLHRICPLVGELMGDAYPEVSEHMAAVTRVVQLEEERFAQALNQGLPRLEDLIASAGRKGFNTLSGSEIFNLSGTYGFPLDLSQEIAQERGMTIDLAAYQAELDRERQRARASWTGSGEESVSPAYREARRAAGPTEFTGYEGEAAEARVSAVLSGGKLVPIFSGLGSGAGPGSGEGEVELALDRTPFYGASGGQQGDAGVIEGEGFHARVTDTLRPLPDLIIHRCILSPGSRVSAGDRVTARVDHERRSATRRNHTATHLLQAALREVLGEHVKQAGSLVAFDRLRFDFSHFTALTPEELAAVEDRVNRAILGDSPVHTEVKKLEEAVRGGATALFGERYGESVRVVTVPGVSQELCGGTHAGRTGEIGCFLAVQEGSVSAGIRRIEAVTGTGALALVRERERSLRELAESLKSSPVELPARVRKMAEQARSQEKKIRELQKSLSGGGSGGNDLMSRAREACGVRYLAAELPGQDASSLRESADQARDRLGSGVVFLASRGEGKALLVCTVSKDLTGRFPAGEIIRRLAPLVGGGGGGRPDMAQAGGKDPAGLDRLLQAVEDTLKEMSA